MSVTVHGNFAGSTINVPSSMAQILFYSTLNSQPNFYLKIEVILQPPYYYPDGSLNKTFYLYPNPTTGYVELNLDFLKTLFRYNYIHNSLSSAINGVVIISYGDYRAKIKNITVKTTEYVGTISYPTQTFNYWIIYTNTDKVLFYDQYQPFINNKIYIHDLVYPVIRQRLQYYGSSTNLVMNIIDANGNVISTPVNMVPQNPDRDVLYFINPTITTVLNNADSIQVTSTIYGIVYNYIYKLIKICQPMGIYVYFLNSRGGLESFWMPTFNLNVTDVKRVDIMGSRSVTNPSWDGSALEMITYFKNFATTGTQTITAETYLLDEYDALALQDLIMSPFIMIQFLEDPFKEIVSERIFYEAVLVDTNYVVNNYRKNKYTTKTFTFKIKRLYR